MAFAQLASVGKRREESASDAGIGVNGISIVRLSGAFFQDSWTTLIQ
jgi:hypothetical protein